MYFRPKVCCFSHQLSQEQKKELDSLKISMSEQIDSVTANIDSLRASSSLWELERVKSLQSCEEAKEAALKSFSRFVNISSPTQMWLSSEVHATRSMTAMADLQGLVGEWSALRAVAAEIQVRPLHNSCMYVLRFLGINCLLLTLL